MLFNTAVYSQTAQSPILLSPPDNSKYLRTTKLTLQWVKVPGFDSYQIQIGTDESFLPQFLVSDIIRNGNAVSAPELENLTEYFWRVRVDGDNPWSETFKFTTTGFPAAVSLIEPPDGSINIDDIEMFSWSADSLNFSYNLQFSRDYEFTDTLKNISTYNTQEKVSGLPKGSTVYWRVKSFNADGIPGDWSEVFSFRTKLNTPRLVSPGNFTNNTDTVITFRWNQVDRAGIYNFELALDESFDESTMVLKTESTGTRITVDSLSTETIYYWRVSAANAFNDSSNWSAPFRFKSKLEKPVLQFPQDGQINVDTDVGFVWSATSDTNYYKFQIAEDSTFNTVVQNITAEDPFTTVTGLENNNYYFWRVNSRNSVGDTSDWSEFSELKTRLAKPVISFPLDSTRVSPENIPVEWSRIEGADYYKLELFDAHNFETNLLDTVISNTHFIIDTLQISRSYALRMKAASLKLDSSSFSDTVIFYTSGFIAQPAAIDTIVNFSSSTETIGLITIHNPTSGQMILKSIYAEPLDTFQTDKSSLILAPFSYDTLKVFFDISVIDTGWFSGSLKIISDDDETSVIPINMYSRFSTAVIITDTLRADTTLSDESTAAKFYLSNPGGNIALKILDYRITGDDVNSFEVTDEIERVSPQDSAEIEIMFKPSKPGKNRANLLMLTNSYPDSSVILPLYGYGTGNFDPVLNDTVNFDTTRSASSIINDFYLRNFNGYLELHIEDYEFTGRDSLSFEIVNELSKIAPQDSGRIRIRFTPLAPGYNDAVLNIKTNSMRDSVVTLSLSGFGIGGQLSESTLIDLESASSGSFETLTSGNRELTLVNSGDLPLEIRTDFVNNYFRITNDDPQPFKIPPGDSINITLQYITPNFDSLNTDSLKIYHDGFHPNPLTYYLQGSFDSAATSQSILNDLIINGERYTGEDIMIGENTSIKSHVDNDLLEDKDNLDFRINYFMGGPGKKISAVKSSAGEYIIPFKDAGSRGLIFKGELFTRGHSYHKIDSVTIFNFIDVQVVLDNYQTGNITVLNSVPALNPADAEVNWVFMGFPFEEVLFDSLFSYFGGSGQMEDGQWILYQYDESDNNYFTPVTSATLEPMKGYFFAQSIIKDYSLSYLYDNDVATRKLNDNVISTEGDGWKTISSPYTFDVEVESPAVLYKYDTNRRSYRLTSIMRPGEGYFVQPDISSLSLKTYGEYYPELFPKVFTNIGWQVNLSISNGRKDEELLISSAPAAKLGKSGADGTIMFDKAPELNSEFEAYITDGDRKYQAAIGSSESGNVWDIYVRSLRDNNNINIGSSIFGDLPPDIDYAMISGGRQIKDEEQSVSLSRNAKYEFKIILGSSEYVSAKLDEAKNSIPEQFSLMQNYPNPFNPKTVIEFVLPADEKVTMKIFDMLGREVKTLLNAVLAAGHHKVDFDASNLASGTYICELSTPNHRQTKKMMLIK